MSSDENKSKNTKKPGISSGTSSSTRIRQTSSSSSTDFIEIQKSGNALDIKATLEAYAQAAMAKLAADVEKQYADRLAFIDQAQKKAEENLQKATNMLTSIDTGLKASSKLTEATTKTHEEILSHVDKVKDEVATVKANAISALSIFVSFFAFITVSINVFSKASTIISAVSLVLIFWCLLVGFNILIAIQFKALELNTKAWLGLGTIIALSFFSSFIILAFVPDSLECVRRFIT